MNLRSPLTRTTQVLLALGIAACVPACADDSELQIGPGGTSGTGGSGSGTGAGGTGGGGGSSVTIEWGPCPDGFQTECATVPLPLDWSDPAGEQIDVFISRQRAANGAAKAQIWFLQGGPGGSGEVFGSMIDMLTLSLPDFDFYVLEHRGVGDSTRLGCPVQESPVSPGGEAVSGNEWIGCIDSLKMQWGAKLEDFTTTADSRDLAKLIEITRGPNQKAFVYGVSYGTTRGLRFLQINPPGIDGVVLDSVVSPGVQYLSQFDQQSDPVAKSLSDLCAADPGCNAKMGPDPWASVIGAVNKLKGNGCPALGQTAPLLQAYLPFYLRLLELRTHIFPLLYRVNRCDNADVQVITHYVNEIQNLLNASGDSGRSSAALQDNVALSEIWEEPAPSMTELQNRCDSVYFCPSVSLSLGSLYDLWPRYPKDEFVGKWPSTAVPVLSMNGLLDPQTPIETAKAIQDNVKGPYQTFVSVPYSPHGVAFASPVKSGGAPCGMQMMIGFLKDPQAPIDTSCLSDLVPVSFTEDPATVLMLFGTGDMWENLTPLKAPDGPPAGWDAFVESIRRAYRQRGL